MKKALFFILFLLTNITSFAQQQYMVSTFAGSVYGFADGNGATALFRNPLGVAVDATGNVYVADTYNHRIRKITSQGVVTTLAGSGVGAGTRYGAYTDGIGTAASFNCPVGIALDATGNVYVADCRNHAIRKITSAGVVTTLAGSGYPSYTDGIGLDASFNGPLGIGLDVSGNVYVADASNKIIRKITPTGLVTTLAGSGYDSYADGLGIDAGFNNPSGLAVDVLGNVYVSEESANRIRKITSAGAVTTLAGNGIASFIDGIGTAASIAFPFGLSVDVFGNVYVATGTYRIRKITASGEVTTIAGSGQSGNSDGIGSVASFRSPSGISVDASGNIFVTDQYNYSIRKLTPIPTATQEKLRTSLNIYPNPASSHFTIEVISPTTVQVLNSLGQVVLSQKVSGYK